MQTNDVFRHLVDAWASRRLDLNKYLQKYFSHDFNFPCPVDRLYLAEMTDGDFSKDFMGYNFGLKWIVNGDTVAEIETQFDYAAMNEEDDTHTVFNSPTYRFWVEQDAVLLSERYGPSIRIRLLGRPNGDDGSASISWSVLWSDTHLWGGPKQ
ncbi:MAG: hypothetical protein ACRC1K_00015 [Planctomycetia bacterium]